MAIDRYTSSVSIPQTLSPVAGTFTIDCSTGTNFFLNASGTGLFENEMNTPTYVGGKVQAIAPSTTNTTVSLTDLTGGLATQPATGDIVIVAYSIASAAGDRDVIVSGGGWTELLDIAADDSNDANLGVFYKIMGASPDIDFDVGQTYATDSAGAVAVHVWRNIDTTNPIDTTTTTVTITNSPLPNPPAITTVTGNAVVLAIGAASAATSTSFTQGGDLSNFITIGSNSTEDAIVGMGSIATTAQATVNPLAFTAPIGTTSDSAAAATVALRPSIKTAAIPITINFTNPTTLKSDISVDIIYNKFYSYTLATYAPTIAWDSEISQLVNLPTTITHDDAISYGFYSQSTKIYAISNNLILGDSLYEKTEIIKSTQSWTVPTGINTIDVLLCGGGAGGDGGTSSRIGGAGSAIFEPVTVTPGATYTITIGAGGAVQGVAGTASSFGTLLTCDGGSGRLNPGGIGGFGENGSDGSITTAPGLKLAGYDEIYGRGGAWNGGRGAANTGQGGGSSSSTGATGGSGVCIIKYKTTIQ